LTTAVKVTTSAKQAASSMAKTTPLKGESYAAEIHEVMVQIAAGLADEYADTGAIPGAIPRNKKGDGVLRINGGSAHIVLEMTNSKRPRWNDYLDEAERHRCAVASLGLVRLCPASASEYASRKHPWFAGRCSARSRHRPIHSDR
jgi:hypothetical protein